jgi:hypothetical protein
MHEPSLYACSVPTQEAAFRFLWDRSLSEPIAARLVVHADGTGILFLRILEHSGIPTPPPPGKSPVSEDEWFRIKSDRQIPVTQQQVSRAMALFSQINFRGHRPTSGGDTTDGSDWIFESKSQGKYRLVDFRNEPTAQAKELGLYLVRDLAQLPLKPSDIY